MLVMETLPEPLGVVRLPIHAPVPAWAHDGPFSSVTRTEHELSIVTSYAATPQDAQREGPWTAFMVQGPLDFSLVGVLSAIADVLAGAGVSIFAISTYDTDYILVPTADAARAKEALSRSGVCRFQDV